MDVLHNGRDLPMDEDYPGLSPYEITRDFKHWRDVTYCTLLGLMPKNVSPDSIPERGSLTLKNGYYVRRKKEEEDKDEYNY